MSVKGEARAEAPSSTTGYLDRLLTVCDRRAGPVFAGFILCHLAGQAVRAHSDGVLVRAGWELRRPFVAAVLVIVFGPFTLFAWRRLGRGFWPKPPPADEKTRALALLEWFTLGLLLLFSAWHVAQVAWPLLSGAIDESDVRGELVASLSSTDHGLPLSAFAHLCAVASAAFFGARQALRLSPVSQSRALARAIVALAVCAYLFGSYAVIRCASGPILP